MNHAIAPDAAWRMRESRPQSQQQHSYPCLGSIIQDQVQAFNLPRLQHSEHLQRFDETLRLITGPIQLLGVGGVLNSVYSATQGGEKLGRYVD